jgi:tRNA nucleotidyltransferase (CCA-adding enzyme)
MIFIGENMWYRLSQQSNKKIDIPLPNTLRKILIDIQNHGGVGYLIGGMVRDALFNKIHGTNIQSKDYDIEVFKIPEIKLHNILKQYGKIDEVGKSFGVIKLNSEGIDYDFSLPRKDSKQSNGLGHKDFTINTDENLSEEEASSRRDVTINSLLYNPLNDELIDPHNGVKDIENKILKHTSNAFPEDPLRVLRLMSLAARFGLKLAPETAELARSIKDHYKHLPKERVEAEFKKLVQKGIEPGRAIKILQQTGWDEALPEIRALKNVAQDSEWHPEIWLDDHTSHVMNEAARIATEHNLTPEQREVLIYAALAHDFAKPETTAVTQKEGRDRITSHGHEEKGGPLAAQFLKSIGVNQKIIQQVVPLVQNHLAHIHYQNSGSTDAFIKQLAEKMHPSNIEALTHLMEADHSGRPPLPKQLPEQAAKLHNRAKELGIHQGKGQNPIEGKDIVQYTGGEGGPFVGQIMQESRKLYLQDKPEMKDRVSALQWLDNRMKKELLMINGNDVINNLGISGPEVKNVLDSAWEAQKAHEFSDKNSAIMWMINKFNV